MDFNKTKLFELKFWTEFHKELVDTREFELAVN